MNKNKKKLKYEDPRIHTKVLQVNSFFDAHYLDAFPSFFNGSELLAASPGCCCDAGGACFCFLAEVEITLFDKTKKRIDEIVIGDIILSYDTKTNNILESKVVMVEHHTRTDGYYNINNNLKVTNDHPIWVNNSWVRVKDIKKDNVLLNLKGKMEKVESIEYIEGEIEVYNIKVEGKSTTYFANEILVNSYWKDII